MSLMIANSWRSKFTLMAALVLGGCTAPMPGEDAAMDATTSDVSLDRAALDVTLPDGGTCVDMDNDGHPSAACGGDDCNDNNPRINPSAREVCDGMGTDEDCNPCTVAEVTPNSRGGDGDADEDGFVSNQCFNRVAMDAPAPMCRATVVDDSGTSVERVRVSDGEVRGTDCADNAANGGTRFPGATEQCNNLDDNCNGAVDETPGLRSTYYRDRDGDGFGDRSAMGTDIALACSPPMGYVSLDTDCNDNNAMINPGAREVCDPVGNVDENCNGTEEEGCGCPTVGAARACCSGRGTETCAMSGTGSIWGACTAMVSPEVCDGVDNNCDGSTDEGLTILCYPDNDDDGFAVMGATSTPVCPDPSPARVSRGRCPVRYTRQVPLSAATSDCDDGAPARYPGNSESCNGVDDNCDFVVDEGLRRTFYRDRDGDGFGDRRAMGADLVLECTTPMGFALNNTDCNDSSAMVNPGAREVCDPVANVDENCNGTAEEGCGCPSVGTSRACCSGRGTETCTMSGMGSVWGACTAMVSAEVCDSVDNNCNGSVDEGLTVVCFEDNDDDGFALATATPRVVCANPMRSAVGGCPTRFTNRTPMLAVDCDDNNRLRFPTNPEICDGVDNDCDAMTVDGAADMRVGAVCSMGTGVGRCASGRNVCASGVISCRVSTAVPEMCNGADDDCDGMSDEGTCVDATVDASGAQSAIRGVGRCVSVGGRPACDVVSCTTNFANCDNVSNNGCETNLLTDANNCGACGLRCLSGACVAGACSSTPVSVTAGDEHACALLSTGQVACWGSDSDGQLGDGASGATRFRPGLVVGLTDAVEVAAGGDTTCARRMSGAVVCWGRNSNGQLGNGTIASSATPVPVTGLTDATQLSVNNRTACARRASGAVACWGQNNEGQLGDGTVSGRTTPVAVMGLSDAVEVVVGGSHACARRASGVVVCWGQNDDGQLGISGGRRTSPVTTPINDATKIAAGQFHTCAVRATGVIDCFGRNFSNQLGGNPVAGSTVLRRVALSSTELLSQMVDVQSKLDHSCGRRADGTTYCWGENSDDQVGGSGLSAYARLVYGNVTTDSVATGGNFTCGRTGARVFCWGSSGSGQLGAPDTTLTSNSAQAVVGFGAATSVAPAGSHTCARVAGRVVCWGSDTTGAIGFTRGANPSSVELSGREVPGLTDVVHVTGGSEFSCALRASGAVSCWGANASGQLGNGTTTASVAPVVVSGLSDAVEIDAGNTSVCARRASGAVVCWGDNTSGQLGNGTTTSSATPVPVMGLTNAIALSVGGAHACARRGDHRVVCWGRNNFGQVGDGSATNRSAPALVNLQDVVMLSAGGEFTCARRIDGTPFCWGSNSDDQLGRSTITPSVSSPTQALNVANNALELVAGARHACVRTATAVQCWGDNRRYQITRLTTSSYPSPVTISSTAAIRDIRAGEQHVCGHDPNTGGLYCWGNNDNGRGGDVPNGTIPSVDANDHVIGF
ncbi:MAG: hypothetical protein JNK05_37940 [Myxococcales bacterium]|nr:hypothetical protein [Myxococcales bacterium]